MDVQPITPKFGSEVFAVDLANLVPADVAAIKATFLERMVLVFRDQNLTREEHKAFGRHFGPLHIHPSKRFLGVGGDPEMFEVKATATSRYANGEVWHNDLPCEDEPPLGSALYLREMPSCGGDTLFANMYEAYDSLSQPLRGLVDRLTAFHDGRQDLANYDVSLRRDQHYPSASHPVAPRHPDTGRKMLFVNSAFTVKINELSRPESDALLRFLYEHVMDQPRFQCRVNWEPGTLVLWDNRCVQHRAVWDYFPETRRGERVTVQGSSMLGSG